MRLVRLIGRRFSASKLHLVSDDGGTFGADAVRGLTGRTVRAFMSQVHIDPDTSAEIFVLEPNTSDPAPTGIG